MKKRQSWWPLLLLALLVAGCEEQGLERKLEKMEQASIPTTVAEATEALKQASGFASWLSDDEGGKGQYPQLSARARALQAQSARDLAALGVGTVKAKVDEILGGLGLEADSLGNINPLPGLREGIMGGRYVDKLQRWVDPAGDTISREEDPS